MDDDDENNEFIYYLMLVTRRLESELSSYRNPKEQYRIVNSPIPSMRLIQNITNVGIRIISPWTWKETYKGKDKKEHLKMIKDFKRITPILNSRSATYKQKYQYMLYMVD